MPPIDEQLRSMIDGAADAVSADEAMQRANSPSASRGGLLGTALTGGRVRALVAAAGALAVVAGVLVVAIPTETHRISTPGAAGTPLPPSIVAVNERQDLVELSSSDGSVSRTISESLSSYGVDSLAVLDSTEAFASNVGDHLEPELCPGDTSSTVGVLSRVSLVTGQVELVDPGVYHAFGVAAAPDGARIAFVEHRCDSSGHLVFADRTGTYLAAFSQPPDVNALEGLLQFAGDHRIEWDADAQHVVVKLANGFGRESWWYADASASGEAVLQGREITADPAVHQLSALGTSGGWAAIIGGAETGTAPSVVKYDIDNGSVIKELLRWDRESVFVRIAAADPSGEHLLLTEQPVRTRTDGNFETNGDTAFYRWSVGDDRPTKLAEIVSVAAWLPDPPAPPTSTTTTTAPEPTFSREVPAWSGILRFFPDGTITADGFNDYLASVQPSWATDPRVAALTLFDQDEVSVEATGETTIEVVDHDDGTTTVTITTSGSGDDSVSGSRHAATFERAFDGTVRFVGGTWAFRCIRGTAPEDFVPQLCP